MAHFSDSQMQTTIDQDHPIPDEDEETEIEDPAQACWDQEEG